MRRGCTLPGPIGRRMRCSLLRQLHVNGFQRSFQPSKVIKSNIIWLVVWLPFLAFSHILGMILGFIYIYCDSNHPNWRTHIFQRGGQKPPTRRDQLACWWTPFSPPSCGYDLPMDWKTILDGKFTQQTLGHRHSSVHLQKMGWSTNKHPGNCMGFAWGNCPA